MKNLLLTAALFCVLCLPCCNCKKESGNPVDQLPAATQTGAGTFGCIVNGKDVLIANYPDAFITYIYLDDIYSKGYFLTIRASQQSPSWVIGILTDSLKVEEGKTYQLNYSPHTKGQASAVYISPPNEYYTQSNLSGELEITKIDEVNQFMSGTFWFDAMDTLNNTKAEIRNGRFDLHFTR